MYGYFCDYGAHTAEYVSMGKTENARDFVRNNSTILGLTALRLVEEPELLAQIKAEHKKALTPTE